jgi:hypothetical protein
MGAVPRSYQATPIGRRGVAGRTTGTGHAGHRALERTRNTTQPDINHPQPDIEAEHWPRIRHSNLIERTFGETRRRTKVIGRLPGERSCLSLVWVVLDRAGRGWRGVVQTPAAVRLLQDLRRQLLHPSVTTEVVAEAVIPAA